MKIRPQLKGYARTVWYYVPQDPETKAYSPWAALNKKIPSQYDNKVFQFQEGFVEGGLLAGFGRNMNMLQNYVGIGYFSGSSPYGKYLRYRDGKLFAQGIWKYNNIIEVVRISDLRENREPY